MEEKLLEMITRLESAIATVAPHMWRIYVHQALVIGWTQIAVAIVSACVSIVFWLIVKYYTIPKMSDENIKDPEPWITITVLCLILSIPFVIVCLIHMGGIRYILNPEYYAIQLLAETIK